MALGRYRFLKYLKAITGPIPTATVSWVVNMFAPRSGNNYVRSHLWLRQLCSETDQKKKFHSETIVDLLPWWSSMMVDRTGETWLCKSEGLGWHWVLSWSCRKPQNFPRWEWFVGKWMSWRRIRWCQWLFYNKWLRCICCHLIRTYFVSIVTTKACNQMHPDSATIESSCISLFSSAYAHTVIKKTTSAWNWKILVLHERK
jgi:hypothetical protein